LLALIAHAVVSDKYRDFFSKRRNNSLEEMSETDSAVGRDRIKYVGRARVVSAV
jgi:hypothetical protein